MLFDRPNIPTLEELTDKYAVKELIEYERFCRDNSLWEQMHTCFAEDSTVCVSWYHGSGHGFVEASSHMEMKAPHKLNSTLVWLNGSKAVAVTMGCIQTRKSVDGSVMDLTSYARFLYTLEKTGGVWLIHSMDCIYEKDCLTPAGLGAVSGVRESYGNLTHIIGSEGYSIAQDLPGDDRPELTAALMEQAGRWLSEKE